MKNKGTLILTLVLILVLASIFTLSQWEDASVPVAELEKAKESKSDAEGDAEGTEGQPDVFSSSISDQTDADIIDQIVKSDPELVKAWEQILSHQQHTPSFMADQLAAYHHAEESGDAEALVHLNNALLSAASQTKQTQLLAGLAAKKAVELDGDNLQAKNLLANYYIQDGAVMKGVMTYREVLQSDSTNETALYQMAMLAIQSNQQAKAIERLEKLVSLHPDNLEYRQKLEQLRP